MTYHTHRLCSYCLIADVDSVPCFWSVITNIDPLPSNRSHIFSKHSVGLDHKHRHCSEWRITNIDSVPRDLSQTYGRLYSLWLIPNIDSVPSVWSKRRPIRYPQLMNKGAFVLNFTVSQKIFIHCSHCLNKNVSYANNTLRCHVQTVTYRWRNRTAAWS